MYFNVYEKVKEIDMKRFIIAMLLVVCFAINSYAADTICPDCPAYTTRAYAPYVVNTNGWFTGIVITNTSYTENQIRLSDNNAVFARYTLAPNETKVINYQDTSKFVKVLGTDTFSIVIISGNPDFGVYSYCVESKFANQ